MVKDFLVRGSAAALTAFVPSLRPALVLAIFLAYYGPEVQATVGLTASYFGIAIVLTAGFTIAALFSLVKHATSPLSAFANGVVNEFRTGIAAGLVLTLAAVVAGLGLPHLIDADPAIFYAFWFTSVGSLAIMPLNATAGGIFQARNRDGANLVLSLIATVLQIAAALFAGVTGMPALPAVLLVGIAGVACDVGALVYRLCTLGDKPADGVRLLRTALAGFFSSPVESLKGFPPRTKGALDGLVLMIVFTIAGTVATGVSARDGAIVVVVVAILRALVIPLKQYGLVGGRLISQRAQRGEDAKATFRLLSWVSLGILATLGLIIVSARLWTESIAIIPWTVVGLMVAQLLIEPITGFAFAAHKVLSDPGFGLRTLTIISFGFTVPALLAVSLTGNASAELVWLLVFVARIALAAAVVGQLASWYRPSKVAVA